MSVWNRLSIGALSQPPPLRLILPAGEAVFKKACRETQKWRRAGADNLYLLVNLSPHQFEHEILVNLVGKTLGETGLPPENLELEITESAIMGAVDKAMKKWRA